MLRSVAVSVLAVAVLSVPTVTGAASQTAAQAAPCNQFPAVGQRLTVAGFESRPSWVQVAGDASAPLLVMFHGLNGCVEELQGQTGLDTLADRTVSVLWLSGVGSDGRAWDGWGANGPRTQAYVRAAVESARLVGAVPRTVVAVGLSMGAVQALMLQCAMPETFAGVVSVAGNDSYRCQAKVERPLLAIGGARDLSIGGGEGTHLLVRRWLDEAISCALAPVAFPANTMHYCDWMVEEIVVEQFGHGWPLPPLHDTDTAITTFAWQIDVRNHPPLPALPPGWSKLLSELWSEIFDLG